MALGARAGQVGSLVLRDVLVLVGIGLAAGALLALAAGRYIQEFLYSVRSDDPATIAGAAGILALVTVAAGYVPARRASRMDPMAALREE
jgi:ABC-type antimicrobial peptide transport system permease subunit